MGQAKRECEKGTGVGSVSFHTHHGGRGVCLCSPAACTNPGAWLSLRCPFSLAALQVWKTMMPAAMMLAARLPLPEQWVPGYHDFRHGVDTLEKVGVLGRPGVGGGRLLA